jgi:hypothetical protein
MILLRRKEIVQTQKQTFCKFKSNLFGQHLHARSANTAFDLCSVELLTGPALTATHWIIQSQTVGRVVSHELDVLCKEELLA